MDASEEIKAIWARLNPQQKLFVVAYGKLNFAYGKASQAMKDAGLEADIETPGSLHTAAWGLRTGDVRRLEALLLDSSLPSPEQIMSRRSQIAFSDIGEMMDDSGRVDPAKAYASKRTGAIRSVKMRPTKAGTEVTVELHDPQPSLQALERVHGLDKQRVEVEAGDKLAGLLAGLTAPWAAGSGGG